MRIKLTGQEKDFLYKKYIAEGMDPVQAGKRKKKVIDYIDNLLCKLKEEGKTKEEINDAFKKEFAKLCEKEESRGIKRNKRRKATRKKV